MDEMWAPPRREGIHTKGLIYGFGLLYRREVVPGLVKFLYANPAWRPNDIMIGCVFFHQECVVEDQPLIIDPAISCTSST